MKGKCLCGAIEVVADDHAEVGLCHCSMCRRWSGGAPFFASQVKKVTFENEENIGRYTSSDWAERGFCKKCGTPLYYRLIDKDMYFVSAEALPSSGLPSLLLQALKANVKQHMARNRRRPPKAANFSISGPRFPQRTTRDYTAARTAGAVHTDEPS